MISFIMILIDDNLHDWTRGFVNMVIKVCGKGSTQEGRAKVDCDARKPEHHDDQDYQDDHDNHDEWVTLYVFLTNVYFSKNFLTIS